MSQSIGSQKTETRIENGSREPGFADLHLHTNFSDGTFTPQELATRAKQVGAMAIALTDHDTVEGCDQTRTTCQELGLEFVAGTELTAEMDGNELHMLGFFL